MTGENPTEGIILDTSLIIGTVKYYAVIGAGLGLLGIILLFQLGAGEQGGAIISGLFTVVILAFAVLSGPLIAAFIGYANADSGLGSLRARTVNSGIANGIGFAVFGVIVAVILLGGLDLLSSGSASAGGSASASGSAPIPGGSGESTSTSPSPSPIEATRLVSLIVLMTIPNSFVGGGITFLLGKQD